MDTFLRLLSESRLHPRGLRLEPVAHTPAEESPLRHSQAFYGKTR
jgi:hypothetical protein